VTAHADRANDEFVWAVSSRGNEAAFTTLEQEDNALPERAKALEGVPQRVEKAFVALVTVHLEPLED
jgi:hypothetical protein